MEGAWNAAAVQTTWKLEPAYMYDKETTVEQSDPNEEATDIVLQHKDSESASCQIMMVNQLHLSLIAIYLIMLQCLTSVPYMKGESSHSVSVSVAIWST